MEPDARYTVIGASVLLLITGLVSSLLWLSKATDDSQYQFYTVFFKEHSLAGLQVDGDVTMKGIRVGSVSSVRIQPDDIDRPKVVLKIPKETPLRQGTEAVIRRNVLTGLAGVDLVPATNRDAPLLHAGSDEEYPTIPEGRASIEAIAHSLPAVVENANELLMRISLLFSAENQSRVESILANLERASASAGDLSSVITSSKEMLQEVGTSASQATTTLSSAVSRITLEVSRIADTLTETTRALSSTAEQLEDPRAALFGPHPTRQGPGEHLP